jgi:hypothetical protein
MVRLYAPIKRQVTVHDPPPVQIHDRSLCMYRRVESAVPGGHGIGVEGGLDRASEKTITSFVLRPSEKGVASAWSPRSCDEAGIFRRIAA